MIKLTQLLRKISEVLINEKARHEELRKRGESFNVFDILGLSTRQVNSSFQTTKNRLKRMEYAVINILYS